MNMTNIDSTLTYKDIFSEDENIDDLLSQFNRELLIKTACSLIEQSKMNEKCYETIKNWFPNIKTKQKIIECRAGAPPD